MAMMPRLSRRRFLAAAVSFFFSALASACGPKRDPERRIKEGPGVRRSTVGDISITVRDTATCDALRPVTGGVPLAKGVAQGDGAFALYDGQGSAVPLQTKVLARWEDRSARWVLLDF
jgi:hypothetical protein